MEPAGVGGGAVVVLEGGEGDGVGVVDGPDLGLFGEGHGDDDGEVHFNDGRESAVFGA